MAATTLNVQFDFLASKIQEDPFLFGEKISIAELVIFALQPFRTGFFEHIPVTYTDVWPELAALEKAIMALPSSRCRLVSCPICEFD